MAKEPKARYTELTQEMKNRILALDADGKSGRVISQVSGVPHSTVSAFLIESFGRRTTKQKASAALKTMPKSAVAKVTSESKVTLVPRLIADNAPICTATGTGTYSGEELSYRGQR